MGRAHNKTGLALQRRATVRASENCFASVLGAARGGGLKAGQPDFHLGKGAHPQTAALQQAAAALDLAGIGWSTGGTGDTLPLAADIFTIITSELKDNSVSADAGLRLALLDAQAAGLSVEELFDEDGT